MSSSRGLDRLLAFCDATVAIAITLLILPLVDIAQRIDDNPVGPYLRDHEFDMFAFALSFIVIAAFWRVHHSMYDDVTCSSPALVRTNLVWLASIVFLPFPTELLGSSGSSRLVHGIYIGTMVVTSGAQVAQRRIITGTLPGFLTEPTLTLGLLVIALVVAVAVPSIGLWALLLLALPGPVVRVGRHRAATA